MLILGVSAEDRQTAWLKMTFGGIHRIDWLCYSHSYSSLKANLRTGSIHVGIHTRNIPKALILHAHWKHMLVAKPLHYLLHAPNNICLLTVASYKGNDLLRPPWETVVVYV